MNILINQIYPNPEQPRVEFDENELGALADSIRQYGVINPIAVEEAGEFFILIDGERRWRAAKLAGLNEIPAEVRPGMNGSGKRDRLLLALAANIQRSNMNPVEEGQAFKKLREMGYSAVQIAEMVGLAESNVYNRIRLTELEPEIQELFAARKLPLHSQVIQVIRDLPDDRRIRTARSFAARGSTMATILSIGKRMGSQPAVRALAKNTTERKGGQWDAIQQLGPGRLINANLAAAVTATCKACVMYDQAAPAVCKECPAVDLLRRIS